MVTTMVDARAAGRRRLRVDPLTVARGLVAERAEQLAGAGDPAAALTALVEVERAAAKARERFAVHLVLDEGWSYARLGRALGVTRQAAVKVYGRAVQQTLTARMRRQR